MDVFTEQIMMLKIAISVSADNIIDQHNVIKNNNLASKLWKRDCIIPA